MGQKDVLNYKFRNKGIVWTRLEEVKRISGRMGLILIGCLGRQETPPDNQGLIRSFSGRGMT